MKIRATNIGSECICEACLLPFASKLTIANLSKQTESRLSLSRCTPSTLRAMLICFVNSYINSGIVYLNLYLSHLCVNPLEHIVGRFTKIHYQNGFAQLIPNSHEFPNSMHHPRIFSSAARVVSTLLLHCGMCGRPRKVLFHICATQYTTVNFDANGNNNRASTKAVQLW